MRAVIRRLELRRRLGPRRSASKTQYTPSSDGLDESAWSLVCDYVRVCAERERKALKRKVLTGRVPQWQYKVAGLYALFAFTRHLETILGTHPTDEAIAEIALRVHSDIAGITTFPLSQVEDQIRMLFGLAPKAAPSTRNTFLLVTAAMGCLMSEPDKDLRSLRPLVARDAASEAELVLRAASK